jgi:hypothetical protein
MEVIEGAPHMDHPNAIDGLRFAVRIMFSAQLTSSRQRRAGLTG